MEEHIWSIIVIFCTAMAVIIFFFSTKEEKYDYFYILYSDEDVNGRDTQRRFEARVHVVKRYVQVVVPQPLKKEPNIPIGKWVDVHHNRWKKILEEKRRQDMDPVREGRTAAVFLEIIK